MSRVLEFRGKTYRSLKSAVEDLAPDGLSYQAVYQRIKSGKSLEEALSSLANESNRRSYEVDGVRYKSLTELARAAGISYEAAWRRMSRGYSDHDVFHGKKRKDAKELEPKKMAKGGITVGGVEYKNVRVAHDAIQPSVSLNTINGRLRYGWSHDEAFGIVDRADGRMNHDRTLVFVIDGEPLNAKQAAEKYRVSYSTLLDRLRRGYSIEQAVGIVPVDRDSLNPRPAPEKNREGRKDTTSYFNGKEYSSLAALARAHGMDPKLVYNRVKMYGWSLERAISEPVTDEVEVDGVVYRSAFDAWSKIGKTTSASFSSRKANGMDIRVCLGLDPLPTLKKYDLSGRNYSSLQEVADAYGISLSRLYGRLNSMSLEEAVQYDPRNGRYTEARFNEDPDLASSPGILYFIKIQFPSGTLHKIGITKRNVATRFASEECEIIHELKGRLEDAYRLEQSALKEFKHLNFRAEESFSGRTECMILTPAEENEFLDYLQQQAKVFGLN